MKTISLISVLLLAPNLGFAQNLLSCGTPVHDGRGNVIANTGCSLQSFSKDPVTVEGEVISADYSITLTSSCGFSNYAMPIRFQVGGVLGNEEILYVGDGPQTFAAHGAGALKVVDAEPGLTSTLEMPTNCSITLVSATPSATGPVISTWLAQAYAAASVINGYADIFARKSEIMTYQDLYFSSEGADKTEVAGLLAQIKSQLPAGDPSIAVIDAILAGATKADVEAKYQEIVGKLRSKIADSGVVYRKLEWAQQGERKVLGDAIARGNAILTNP